MSIESNYMKCPREFTVEPLASALSISAKVLYTILADESEISENNREFQDDDGTPFVYFTIEELAAVLGCSKRTVDNTLKELENIGLIYRCRQYSCKANKIYVKDVEKVMLKVSESNENRHAKYASQSRKICVTDTQNMRDGHAKYASQSRKDCVQSISELSNQKIKSNEQVKCIKSLYHKMSTTTTTTTTLILTMKIMNCNKNYKNNVTSKRNKENNKKQKKQKSY